MDEKDASAVVRHFDGRGAREYEDRIRAVVPGYEALHETACALPRHRLGEGAHLLVVGSGTGAEIFRMGEENPGWRGSRGLTRPPTWSRSAAGA